MSSRAGAERLQRDLGRADVAVQQDVVALRLERLVVELAEQELLGEVLVADRHRRLAGPGQDGAGRVGRSAERLVASSAPRRRSSTAAPTSRHRQPPRVCAGRPRIRRRSGADPSRNLHPSRAARVRVSGRLELVVERIERRGQSRARSRSASRRTRRSSAAAARAGRCRSRRAPVRPRSRLGRCCRGHGAHGPVDALTGPRYVRPPWFSNPASTRRSPGSSSTSIATLPISRGPSSRTVVQVDQPGAGERLLGQLVGVPEQLIAAAHGEDHRSRGRRPRAAASRLTSARSSAHSLWSRS